MRVYAFTGNEAEEIARAQERREGMKKRIRRRSPEGLSILKFNQGKTAKRLRPLVKIYKKLNDV